VPELVFTAREVPEISGKAHTLKHNPASHRPSNLLFLDTETYVAHRTPGIEWQRFRLGVTCFLRRRFAGRSDSEVWNLHLSADSLCAEIEERTREKTSLFVYASNPGFDLWVLRFYTYFAERDWRAAFIYDEGLRFILVCRKEKRTIKICAVQNYYPVGVKALGDWLGLPKLECDPLTAENAELVEYCKRDVEILKAAVCRHIDLCEKNDMGAWGLTLSGQAFNAFRHKHLSGRVWVHRDPNALVLERAAYFGGRTEAFQLGTHSDGPYVEYDVNGLYPAMMQRYKYPVNLKGVLENPTLRQVEIALHRGCVAADVEIETDRPLWAVALNGHTCFPVGRFRTGVCSMGLSVALSTGALRKVFRMAVYKRAPLFTTFINDFYALKERYKENGDKVGEKWAKLLMNSLYGKFGQANPIEVERHKTESAGFYRQQHITKDPATLCIITQLMHTIWVHRGRQEHRDSMPVVAAHVTEYGRFYLAQLITLAGWENVLYCDTDSLILPERKAGPLRAMVDPVRLGMLDERRKVHTLTIYGLKDYVRDGERVTKAVPKDALEYIPGAFISDWFPGTKTLLTRPRGLQIPQASLFEFTPQEVLDFQGEGLYPVMRRAKVLDRAYNKGTVGVDGHVKPYFLT